MSTPEPCFLVEWYEPAAMHGSLERTTAVLEASAAAVSACCPTVTLKSMIAVPSDKVLFGVFSAGSADLVFRACEHAGLPADRLSAATGIRLAPVG